MAEFDNLWNESVQVDGAGDPDASRRKANECHKCKWSFALQDCLAQGGDEKVLADIREHCTACSGPADMSYKGISYVHLDALPAPDEFIERESTDQTATDPDDIEDTSNDTYSHGVSNLPETVEDAIIPIVAALFGEDDTDLLIFKHVYHGYDTVETGVALGLSKQVVWARLKKMCKRNRVISAVVRQLIRTGAGGAVKKGSRAHQGDLFM